MELSNIPNSTSNYLYVLNSNIYFFVNINVFYSPNYYLNLNINLTNYVNINNIYTSNYFKKTRMYIHQIILNHQYKYIYFML